MKKIKQAILSYNLSDNLPQRYGHKLRGFFANNFSEVLFHNHKDNGEYRYGYPLIQYKIINGTPVITGLEDGAKLISQNFLDIEELILADQKYIDPEMQLKVNELELKVYSDLNTPKYKYELMTPWIGLNQSNYQKYKTEIQSKPKKIQDDFLNKIMIGNILSFAKGIDWWVEDQIEVISDFEKINIQFKNKDMIGFVGEFYSNIKLPNRIGLGKSTTRGFGTIRRSKLT